MSSICINRWYEIIIEPVFIGGFKERFSRIFFANITKLEPVNPMFHPEIDSLWRSFVFRLIDSLCCKRPCNARVRQISFANMFRRFNWNFPPKRTKGSSFCKKSALKPSTYKHRKCCIWFRFGHDKQSNFWPDLLKTRVNSITHRMLPDWGLLDFVDFLQFIQNFLNIWFVSQIFTQRLQQIFCNPGYRLILCWRNHSKKEQYCN